MADCTVNVTENQCHMRFPKVEYIEDDLPQQLHNGPATVDRFVKNYNIPVAPLAHSADLPQHPVLFRRGMASHGTNGFINAIAFAYYRHVPLVIRPDDVWIEILSQLAFYTEVHAEKFREKLVSHQGSKELIIRDQRWESVEDIKDDHRLTGFVDLTCEWIKDHVKIPGLKEWYTTEFSTSTSTDQTVKCLLLMASLKKYFSYGFSYACGFPDITLKGTKGDWMKLREQVTFLKTFGDDDLTYWADVMTHTLGHFVAAYDGQVDESFWQSGILKKGGYSSYDNSTIHGWLLAFAPFDKKAKSWLSRMEDIQEKHIYTYKRITHEDFIGSVRIVNMTFSGRDQVEHKLEFSAGVYDELRMTDIHSATVEKPISEDFTCHIRSAWTLKRVKDESSEEDQ